MYLMRIRHTTHTNRNQFNISGTNTIVYFVNMMSELHIYLYVNIVVIGTNYDNIFARSLPMATLHWVRHTKAERHVGSSTC